MNVNNTNEIKYQEEREVITSLSSKIKNIELVKEDYSLYTLENDLTINADSILGTIKNTTSYSILGSIYSIVTSKWGYLIIIIMPMLAAFICEIYQIIKEVKR